MNTVRILICVTFALLVGALVHSYTTNGSNSGNTSQANRSDDVTLRELRQEHESLRLENKRRRDIYINNPTTYNQFQNTTPPVTVPNNEFVNPLATPDLSLTISQPEPQPEPDTTATDELERQINQLAEENDRLREQQALTASENEMLQQEAEVIQEEILSPPPVDAARAKAIASAMVMARVQVYDPDSGILILDLVRPQNISPGEILGIRRGDAGGIIGRIRIANMEGMNGSADPIASSFFGEISILEGDEIIVIP